MSSPVPTLCEVCLESLVQNSVELNAAMLSMLPDPLSLALFERIIASGKLTPRLLQAFEDIENQAIVERVRDLGLSKWTPPLIPDTRNRWLGQRPPFW